QAPLVGLGQELVSPPLRDQPGHQLPVLLVVAPLLGRHGDEEVLLEALGELLQHLRLLAADEDGRQRSSDAIQVAIAYDSAAVGFAYLMVMEQPERRPEAVLVDELDDRDQLLEPVLEGRGAHDEHPLEPDVTGEDLRGGDGLQGLPEPHLVRDEAPPGPGGEERPLTLVVVEAGADEPGEGGAPDASRKGATEDLPP